MVRGGRLRPLHVKHADHALRDGEAPTRRLRGAWVSSQRLPLAAPRPRLSPRTSASAPTFVCASSRGLRIGALAPPRLGRASTSTSTPGSSASAPTSGSAALRPPRRLLAPRQPRPPASLRLDLHVDFWLRVRLGLRLRRPLSRRRCMAWGSPLPAPVPADGWAWATHTARAAASRGSPLVSRGTTSHGAARGARARYRGRHGGQASGGAQRPEASLGRITFPAGPSRLRVGPHVAAARGTPSPGDPDWPYGLERRAPRPRM